MNGNGTTCTGVLVSPNQVLTAGHCVCKSGQAPSVVVGSQVVFPTVSSAGPNPATAGFNSVYIVTSIDTNSNWLAGNCGEGNYSIVWDKERESYDLAVLTLNTSVLSSVATPVAIQFSSHTNLERFATAGFGANSANGDVMCDTSGSSVSCTGYDDLRRNGRVLNVWYKDDICDKSSLDGPCWHTPILMSHLFSNAPTQSLSGDSGSPVVGFLPGSNVARLIGIHVYRFDDGGYQYGKQMVRVRLANDESKSFLASKITSVANDLDGDGISDVADNCKPGACTTHGFVGCKEDNPDQADADGDGVGDSCDNCSPINSKKCPSGTTCANPNNSDYDGDGFGDTCDPFPGCAANDFASCVGCTVFYQTAYCSFNGGTNCAGTGRFTASCTSTANCPSVAGQQCLLDGTSGRCLKPADSDSDTVADVCDQCPNFANNTFNGTDFNSNPDAELNANVQALGDQCDPAPIAPLGDPDTPPVITVNNGIPTQPSQTEVRRHGFFTNTSRGKVTANEVAKSDPGSIRFRGCQCDPTATLCVDRNGSCNTAVAPLTATANWKPISMTNASGTALPNPPVANNEMFSNTGYGPNKKWYWQWYSDVYTLGTFSQNLLVTTKDDGSTLQYPYMLAGIATDVAPTGTWATTGRTREDSNNLRYTFIQAYPGAVDTVTNNNHPNLPQFSNNCQFTPTCGIWANWQKLIYINPGDMLYDDGLSIGFPHDNVMDMAGYATDKQVPIATSLARSFSNLGSYVVAPAVESTRQRRWNGDYREFAILPTEFKPTVSVKIARLGPQGMKLDTRVLTSGANLKTGGGASGGEEVLLAQNGPESAPDGTFFGESGSSGQSSKSSTVSPQATTGTTGYTGYRALFSTTLDTVFVAGGSNSDEENDTIWAYDLRKMRWYPAITQARFAPSAKVRSMALDAARNWLYVMFDIDGSNVQLVRYDLRRDTGTLAQTFTSRPVYPGTYLNTLADGTVVLTASKNGEYLSCAYDAGANRFLGSIQSTTTSVPFPPQLGGSGLVLPVVDASQHVTYTTVTRASFTGTTTCSVL